MTSIVAAILNNLHILKKIPKVSRLRAGMCAVCIKNYNLLRPLYLKILDPPMALTSYIISVSIISLQYKSPVYDILWYYIYLNVNFNVALRTFI